MAISTAIQRKSSVTFPPVQNSCLLTKPNEILWNILTRAKKEDVYHASLACRHLKVFIDDSELWKSLLVRDCPHRLPTLVLPVAPVWKDLYSRPFVAHANIMKKIAAIIPAASHPASVTTLSCQGTLLLSGDEDGIVKVRKQDERGNFEDIQTLGPCLGGIFKFEHGYFLFTSENTLKIYQLNEQGRFGEIQTLDVDGTQIAHFKMEKDELTISTIAQNSVVYRKGPDGLFQECNRLDGFGLALVQGEYLFAAGDQAVQVWKKDGNHEFQNQQADLTPNPSEVRPSWIFFENDHFILADFEGTIQIWKQEKDGSFIGPVIYEVGAFQNLMSCFDVRGDVMVAGMSKGALVVLKKDMAGEFKVQSQQAHLDRINSLSFCENDLISGCYLVSGSTDGTFKIWERNEEGIFSLLQTLEDPQLNSPVTNVSIVEGSKIYISYASGAVKMWDFFPTHK